MGCSNSIDLEIQVISISGTVPKQYEEYIPSLVWDEVVEAKEVRLLLPV